MRTAQSGDTVKILFIGSSVDGELLLAEPPGESLSFQLGANQSITGLETGIIGMQIGEIRMLTVEPAAAFGEWQDSLTVTLPRTQLPATFDPQPGEYYQLTLSAADTLSMRIIATTPDTITLDGNHPLAGRYLQLRVELLAIN